MAWMLTDGQWEAICDAFQIGEMLVAADNTSTGGNRTIDYNITDVT